MCRRGLLKWHGGKEPPASGDVRHSGSIPGAGRSLEEGLAAHSSILAWRIPWAEEPGRYSPESQRGRQDLEAKHSLTYTNIYEFLKSGIIHRNLRALISEGWFRDESQMEF